MRGASMPDSRATMASASSEVWRCWVSKSAGTYSASITGVIGNTLRMRTAPLIACDSVAAVAIAGLARSVSARSIGTRMDLNICGSHLGRSAYHGAGLQLILRHLPQQFRADEQRELAAAERHVAPVVDVEVEHGEARGRQIVLKRLDAGLVAAAREHQSQFVHAGIMSDQHQPLWI